MAHFSSDPLGHPRGRLMTARQIALEIFCDPKRERWVRQTVAPETRYTFGHSTVMWRELDVVEWVESKRGVK